MKTNDFNEAGSNRDAYQRDYDSSVSGMGRPDDHRGLRQELAHETNNIAVYINGKLWKVWAGKGTADSREERAYLNSMQNWADKKSAATGKKWTVGLTGANVSEAASAAVRMQRAADKQRAKSDASLARTPSSIPKKEEPKQPNDQKGVAEARYLDITGVQVGNHYDHGMLGPVKVIKVNGANAIVTAQNDNREYTVASSTLRKRIGTRTAAHNAYRFSGPPGVAEGSNPEYDDEAGMAKSNLRTMARAVNGLMDTIGDNDNLPEWAQEKIAKAEMMTTSVWDYLLSQKEQGMDPQTESITEVTNPTDIICVDVPLFIRLMEYAREDASTDMDLHSMAERLTAMSSSGEPLGMDSYDAVVGSETPVEEASLAQMRDYFSQPDNNTVKIDNQYGAPERKTQAHVPPEIQSLINKMYRVGKITPQEFETLKNFQLKTKINVGLNIKEADKNPYAIGMASAMNSTGDKPPLKKSTINKAHEIARAVKKGD